MTAAFAGDATYPARSVSATFNITTPSRLTWVQVSARSPLPYSFACGLTSDASLACWGNNS